MRLEAFPVQGGASYRDTWGDARSGGRTHAGTDIFAPRGAPVVAVAGGWLTQTDGGLGGRGAALTLPDATYFYYAHLDDWEGDYPRRVQAGEVIGYVGDSGNAAGGPTHLHFEWHPQGGEPENPFPLLEEFSQSTQFLEWTPNASSKPKKTPKSTPSDEGAALFLLLLALSKGFR